MWKKASGVLLAALFAAGWLIGEAEARPQRPGQIPNGGVNSCANCHVSAFGGGARNVFGQQVEAGFLTSVGFSGDVIWGPELAALDADGDGFTNGEELGDPEGTWKIGDPAPGNADEVTRPWDPESHPPEPEPEPVPMAVEQKGWGKIKELMREFLE
jgi:dopamine beta-monooxygenase